MQIVSTKERSKWNPSVDDVGKLVRNQKTSGSITTDALYVRKFGGGLELKKGNLEMKNFLIIPKDLLALVIPVHQISTESPTLTDSVEGDIWGS